MAVVPASRTTALARRRVVVRQVEMAQGPLPLRIVAVHGGAGFHPKSADPELKHALRL